jgi:hypothetical protein
MQNWITAGIVALAVFYLIRRFHRSLQRGKATGSACGDGCSGCQVSSSCEIQDEVKDE